jgi:hypothetical protein
MTPEQSKQIKQELEREKEAKKIVNNKEFVKAFEDYKAELFKAFSTSKYDEIEKREELYRQVKSLNTVRGKLEKVLITGKMASEQLSVWQKAKKNMRIIK